MFKALYAIAAALLIAGLWCLAMVVSLIVAAIGTAIGIAVFVIIVVAWLYFSYRQYRRNKRAS